MNKRYKVKYEIVNTVAEKHNIVSCKQNILLAYMYRDYVLGVFGSAFEIYIKKLQSSIVLRDTVFLQFMWTNKERPTFNWFANDW